MLDKLVDFLNKCYKSGNIIYPSVISRRFKIDKADAYRALDILVGHKLIKRVYAVHCPKCNRIIADLLYSMNDLQEEYYCENCDIEAAGRISKLRVVYVKV